MKISTKGRYATRVMLDLALHNTGQCIKVKDIAARQGISEKYLEQIIAMLNKFSHGKAVKRKSFDCESCPSHAGCSGALKGGCGR